MSVGQRFARRRRGAVREREPTLLFGVVTLRDARAEDASFLADMLVVAADWRGNRTPRGADDILRIPEFAHYIVGWPRPGDCGVVAEDRKPVGAAWFRFLPLRDRGFGYIADAIPEITIGVRQEHRGRGIGERLLRRLLDRARDTNISAVSLSVEDDNPATHLYERLGFVQVHHAEGAATMVIHLDL
jgi:ribosomal protein S18 acetylase RimI-like enzyme